MAPDEDDVLDVMADDLVWQQHWDRKALRDLMFGLIKDGRAHTVALMFPHMQVASLSFPVHLYEAGLLAYTEDRQWETALDLFHTMGTNGVTRTEYVYTKAMTAYDELGQHQDALDLFDEFVESGKRIGSEMCSAAIAACGNSGQWDRLWEIVDVYSRNPWRSDDEIDVHWYSVSATVSLVRAAIMDVMDRPRDLSIVVGRGLRTSRPSEGSTIKAVVTMLVESFGIQPEIDDTGGAISISEDQVREIVKRQIAG